MLMFHGAKYCPASRTEYGRYAAPDSLPPPLRVLLSLLPNSCVDRSRSFGNASGWMKRAGSVGFHVPSRCCHCLLKLMTSWKLRDMFFASVPSTFDTTTRVQSPLVSR